MTQTKRCEFCGGQVSEAAGPCPLSFTCPTCKARPREWCKRPSEHKAARLHVDRVDLEFAEAGAMSTTDGLRGVA